ncbi:MAG: TlpA disulfide reductase family protein [Cucumibacter sp.]
MTENRQQDGRPSWRRWGIGMGLVAAATGIIAAILVSNGGWRAGSGAVATSDCRANAGVYEAIDAAAQGELAALRATASGHSYDDLKFLDPAGAPTGLTAFRGEVLLVNFWASWCVPCRKEMPALSGLQTIYGERGLEVVTINLDIGEEGPEKGRAFMEEIGLDNLPLYADPSLAIFDALRQRGVALGLPTTLLIGPDGCEWGVLQGPAEWDTPDGHRLVEAALGLAGSWPEFR